jgi:hypothetical protein
VQCEIDQRVVEVSKKYLGHITATAFEDPRVELLFMDAAKYMEAHSNEFDVIIVDSSDPVGPAETLYTSDFYRNMSQALKEGGIVCTQGECQWLHLDLIHKVMADAKAHNSIGDLCAVRGCADPYAAASVPKAPLPTPPTPTVNPTSPSPYTVSSTLYIDSTYTAATIMAADVQTKLAAAIATSADVAASAVKIVSAKAYTPTSRHLLQESNIVEVAFTVTTAAASATAVEDALAVAWNGEAGQPVVNPTTTVAATVPTPETRLTTAGLTGITDVKLNSAPASVETASSGSSSSSSSSPDVSAQVSAEYIVLSVALLIVMTVGGGACVRCVRGGQKR